MTTTPPDAPVGAPGDPGGTAPGSPAPGTPLPPGDGPRVPRDHMKELGRLRRSRSNRKIAGVAGGIARHLDVDPLIVRVAFVILVFFGGGGILAYGAAWLLVPDEATDEAVIRLDERSRTVALAIAGSLAALSVIGDSLGGWGFPWPLAIAGLIAVVVLANHTPRRHPGPLPAATPTSATGTAYRTQQQYGAPPGTPGTTYAGYRPPPPRDPRRRGPVLFGFTVALTALVIGILGTFDLAGAKVADTAYPAAALATVAVMLVVGAFWGRAGGLIALGLLATMATAVTAAASNFSAGQIDQTPRTAAAVDSSYSLGAGEIILDLTEVEDLEELDGRTIDLDANFGRIEVVVPDGLDVEVDASVDGAGETRLFGERESSSDRATHDGGVGAPQITIDATVVFGEIVVDDERTS